MIFMAIFTALLFVVRSVFSVLPTVPATPTAIVDGGQWIIDQIAAVISVLNMLFTPALVAATMVIVVGTLNFEWIYHTVMWILKKIPMVNLK